MWRPAKRIFIEENDREAKKRERGREREKRKDPMGGIIRSRGNECIFFGARLPPFFNSCPSHSCEPTNGVPDHPFPLKLCVSHPLGRKPEGGGGGGRRGDGRRGEHADITRPEELFSTGLMVSEL